MRKIFLLVLFVLSIGYCQGQTVNDDFEGNGTISTWFGDDCGMDINFANLYQEEINTSNTVLEYDDIGGLFANVRFDVASNIDLSTKNTFSLKIFVPTTGLTGNQPNQVSLKLQDGTLGAPWSTQSEIIKPILLDQWQVVTFDFENDNYINLDAGSPPPTQRSDFNRVVIQVNGENNSDHVVAYIDDIDYYLTISEDPVFDNLVWSDDFNGSGAIKSSHWFQQTQIPSGGNWYNGEVQHYTNRLDNSFEGGGNLNIVAKKEDFNDQGYTKEYTSARLNSKFAFTYGRVEIRAKLPSGVGTWPALWMLGKNIDENGAYWDNQGFGNTLWPACGEIDIMEHWGDNQNYVQSALHTPSSYGGTVNLGGQTIPTASTEFHVYELYWSSEKMVFTVDGIEHYTYNPEVKNSDTWPFDAEQYLLFNVAMLPNVQPSFVQSTMEIDYVRIYQESALSTTDLAGHQKSKLFPNPVNENLTIKMPQSRLGAEVTIYSIQGEKLSSYVQNNLIESINMTAFASGIYLVRIENKDIATSHKIIKE